MRIKSAYKYQLNELLKPVMVYYIIIAALSVLTVVAAKLWMTGGSISGWDGATIIFLFICGLSAFKASFHMFMANGISRKAMFIGTITAIATVAIGMALIDGVIGLVLNLLIPYNSVFANQYAGWYGIHWNGLFDNFRETAPMVADGVVWRISSYTAAAMTGLFLTTAFYRMNKPVKLLVSIGVPVLLLIVWPIVDATVFNGAMTAAVLRAFGWVSSLFTNLLGTGNPYIVVLYNVFWILLLGGLTWLLTRRATVKTQ